MSKIHALVVDDDPHIVKLIALNLQARGFNVTTANDGESALEYYRQTSPDIVLLDITLPGIDGFQVCNHIRHLSDTPVIMISANA